MGKHFTWTFVTENRLVMLHTERNPSAEEWDEYMRRLSGLNPSNLGLLVLTSGGAPDAAQRKQLNDWIGKEKYRRAVVTDSVIARGAIVALTWFDASIRAFSPDQLQEAYRYLEVNERDQLLFRQTIGELKLGMDLTAAWWAHI